MIHNKYLSILTVLLLTIVITAACRTNKSNLSTQNINGVEYSFLDSLPQPNGRVSDYEGIFSIQEKFTLDSLLYDFEKKTTIQIAVVIIDTSMTTAANFDDYTLKLARAWGIGQRGKDNGVLIGIAVRYRKIRIQNAIGIEKILTNEETGKIIDNDFIPNFRKSEYYAGTKEGLAALMSILANRYQ